MKYLVFTLSILFLIFNSMIYSDVFEDRLVILKELSIKLQPDILNSINSDDIRDTDYLYEVLNYIERMNKEYPLVLGNEKKDYMIEYFDKLEEILRVNTNNVSLNTKNRIQEIATEKLSQMVENVLLIPKNVNKDQIELYIPKVFDIKTKFDVFSEKNIMFDSEVYSNKKRDEIFQLGSINVSYANIRKGPSTDHDVITVLEKGIIVTILKKIDDWFYIEFSNSQNGYIHSNLIDLLSSTQTGKINVTAVNMRKGPGIDYDVIRVLGQQENLEILGRVDNWYHIKTQDNIEGYVYYKLVSINSDDKLFGYISVTAANVRIAPGTENEIIDTLDQNTKVVILGIKNDWYYVEIPNGKKGYIYKTLVVMTSENSSETSEKIVESALGAVGQSDVIYGIDCYTEITHWGYLACAIVVSAILDNADVGNEIHISCVLLRNHLRYDLGWKELENKNYLPGDVCFWKIKMNDRPRHVGVIVQKDIYNKWWAVDNSSIQKVVLKRPLLRSYYPCVDPVSRIGK